MNFTEFEIIYFDYFKKTTGLIKRAAEIAIDMIEDQEENYIEIDAYDGASRVGMLDFVYDQDQQDLYVDLVIVQKEYRNSNVANLLFERFRQIYKERFDNWTISADFYNKKLSRTFKTMLKRYKMPPEIDNTSVKEITEEQYDQWEKEKEEELFGHNRQYDLASFPKPYKKYAFDRPENLTGNDVIYKNLTQDQINKVKEVQVFGILMFKGSDTYYGFDIAPFDRETMNPIFNDIKPDTFYNWARSMAVTKDLNVFKDQISRINQYTSEDPTNNLALYYTNGKELDTFYQSTLYKVNSEQEIDQLIDKLNNKEQVARLRKLRRI